MQFQDQTHHTIALQGKPLLNPSHEHPHRDKTSDKTAHAFLQLAASRTPSCSMEVETFRMSFTQPSPRLKCPGLKARPSISVGDKCLASRLGVKGLAVTEKQN